MKFKFDFQGIFVIVKSEKVSRHLLVTSNFICKIHDINDTNAEWCFAINAIISLKISKCDSSYIAFQINTTLNKKLVNDARLPLKNKDEYTFHFKYKKDRGEILFLVRKTILTNTDSYVKIIYS